MKKPLFRPVFALALILPILVLGLMIGLHQRALFAATDWRIPISGYDPRDPLRGHYLLFAYDWKLRGDAAICTTPSGCILCLHQEGADVAAQISNPETQCLNRVDLAASTIRFTPGTGGPARFSSRIFVSETSAPALEAELRQKPGYLIARLARDGRLIARRVTTD